MYFHDYQDTVSIKLDLTVFIFNCMWDFAAWTDHKNIELTADSVIIIQEQKSFLWYQLPCRAES